MLVNQKPSMQLYVLVPISALSLWKIILLLYHMDKKPYPSHK